MMHANIGKAEVIDGMWLILWEFEEDKVVGSERVYDF